MRKLSIIFSFRNEEAVLAELVSRTTTVAQSLNEFDYELIFVNDDSTDNSLAILQTLRKSDLRVKIINMSRRFGVSECVLAGMEYATGDIIVYLDADLQDPPEVITHLIETWKNDQSLGVIHTNRRIRLGESWIKLKITQLGYWILNKSSFVPIPANRGDFKLLTREAVNHLLQMKERKPFIRGMISWIGFKQAEILYDRSPRFAGRTKFPVFSLDVINNFLDSALISFSDKPLKFALVIGALSCLSGCLLIGWIMLAIVGDWSISELLKFVTVLLLIGGIQILMIGFLGLYVHSIFLEVKNRPRHVIKNLEGIKAKES